MPEEVPTISVEPPRNPQQMDKAVRGLVEGRYEWIAFTSVNAVRAVREKFEEYGLDARAFSGLKIAAVGDKTAASLAEWGLRADLVPSGEQSARGLLEDWPEYDELLDPINRVFLPRADIATETLVAGLLELGWEVDDVTAYRTVRAAPPAAPVRDAIKTGKFDAVVFTSSSTVRNLVGIAGQAARLDGHRGDRARRPRRRRRSTACGSTSWRRQPSVEELVDALADFGAARRLAMIEAGQPVTKPSERRPASRRKASGSTSDPRHRASQEVTSMGPVIRPRRLRRTPALRDLVAETTLAPSPAGAARCSCARARPSRCRSRRMPGVVQHTRDSLRKAAAEAAGLGLGGHHALRRPDDQGRPRLRAPWPPTASSTSRSATSSPRWATRCR